MGRQPRILYLSTYPPRPCGIATFTADLSRAVERTAAFGRKRVIAVSRKAGTLPYGREVVLEIEQDRIDDYERAARWVNEHEIDLVCIQHEFGIFGGPHGAYLMRFLEGLRRPAVVTLHTVLSNPPAPLRDLTRAIAMRSAGLVTLARRGVQLLTSVYGIDPARVYRIPHGAPHPELPEPAELRRQLGLEGRRVIMTFGLVNPGKGIEYAIQAMPRVAARHPAAIYLVIGATHPEVRQLYGETYRETLFRLAAGLGVSHAVRFIDRYLTFGDLVRYLGASDVFLTPYPNREQICSGTLTYAVALGKAVVSTPYLYAEEVLNGSREILVPFRDEEAIGDAVAAILDSPYLQSQLEERARSYGAQFWWENVAARYRNLFLAAVADAQRPVRLAHGGGA